MDDKQFEKLDKRLVSIANEISLGFILLVIVLLIHGCMSL